MHAAAGPTMLFPKEPGVGRLFSASKTVVPRFG